MIAEAAYQDAAFYMERSTEWSDLELVEKMTEMLYGTP